MAINNVGLIFTVCFKKSPYNKFDRQIHVTNLTDQIEALHTTIQKLAKGTKYSIHSTLEIH